MNSRIGVKLLASYILLVVITLVIAGVLLNPLFKGYLLEARKQQLLREAEEIAALANKLNNREMNEETFNRVMDALNSYTDTRFLIIDREGTVIASSLVSPGPDNRPFFHRGMRIAREETEQQVLSGQTIVKQNVSRFVNVPVITVGLPVTAVGLNGEKRVGGAVFAFSPVRQVTDLMKKNYYYLAISSLIAVLLAAAIAFYFSRLISQPLKNMNEAALRMAGGNYKTRIEPSSRDEVGELATSLNYLANQLDLNVTALQQEKSKLESIVTSINEGLLAVDRQGRIILANPVVENIVMTPSKKITGQRLADVTSRPDLVRPFEAVLESGLAASSVLKIINRSFRVAVSPIKQEDGSLLGAVGILQDISEMEKVEQLRRDFIANVSHELRAPITVIRGYVDCLLDGVADNAPDYYHRIIKSETLRLERLIKDIMDLSLLQSGKIQLELEEVDLAQLVSETAGKFKQRAKAKDINLITDTGNRQNITAYCDPDRMEQLLVILLDNALKFTPGGGTVEVLLKEESNQVVLSVKDSGIGISEEDLPYIWERFYKADKSRSRMAEDGTGLGLFIAKQIAELHQAELAAESEPSRGSTFTLRLRKQQ
ncbi:MAG: ATP-binding protein [Peptococcaceae bacterium]|jgi:two-component system sensor histidine kinase ResE|nr:cell wall metabolism sensor histidine kinase WalK [Peptococcaceae bacterium]MDH7525902.1 ATP-binding protein [Peptococcaceae bacterium]